MFVGLKIMPTFASVKRKAPRAVLEKEENIALWCNGSTSDSGSACESSNLSKAT